MTLNPELQKNNELLQQFKETRNRTLELVKNLEKDDFVVQTAPYMSPPKWHIGHVSWIYEAIISKIDKNYKFHSKELSEYLNSYYQQFGLPHDKGLRGIISRPTTNEIFQYFNTINQKVEKFIETHELNEQEKKLIITGFHHECQHQELLVYDLQHLLAEQYLPVRKSKKSIQENKQKEFVKIKGGIFEMGYNGKEFSYDIELPEHKTYLEDYEIGIFPITNREYLKSPMYWEKIDEEWYVRDFLGIRKINPNEPVCHVSYYEADAYCKWAGKRLPTEAEWEKAACWNETKQEKTIFPWGNNSPTEENCNLLESYHWGCTEIGTYPSGKSPSGCEQMIGDVWEWTSSEFVGYPGFKSGFDEYNDKWFTNQKVLRGGSFGTPKMSIRGSYRNFFRLDERWLFSGFRCVENI